MDCQITLERARQAATLPRRAGRECRCARPPPTYLM
jgi:hypothetical protein